MWLMAISLDINRKTFWVIYMMGTVSWTLIRARYIIHTTTTLSHSLVMFRPDHWTKNYCQLGSLVDIFLPLGQDQRISHRLILWDLSFAPSFLLGPIKTANALLLVAVNHNFQLPVTWTVTIKISASFCKMFLHSWSPFHAHFPFDCTRVKSSGGQICWQDLSCIFNWKTKAK